jgi:hypothetical protein
VIEDFVSKYISAIEQNNDVFRKKPPATGFW